MNYSMENVKIDGRIDLKYVELKIVASYYNREWARS